MCLLFGTNCLSADVEGGLLSECSLLDARDLCSNVKRLQSQCQATRIINLLEKLPHEHGSRFDVSGNDR
jgi:hypothetical protein